MRRPSDQWDRTFVRKKRIPKTAATIARVTVFGRLDRTKATKNWSRPSLGKYLVQRVTKHVDGKIDMTATLSACGPVAFAGSVRWITVQRRPVRILYLPSRAGNAEDSLIAYL